MRLPKLVVLAGLVFAFALGHLMVWGEKLKSSYSSRAMHRDRLDDNVASERLA